MTDTFAGFNSRLKKIEQKHARLARGYQSRVGKDGLIVFKPKRRQHGFPFRALVFLTAGFFLFKGMIMSHIGEQMYDQRVATLAEGTLIEQVGAFAMQSDPVTTLIANRLHRFLN